MLKSICLGSTFVSHTLVAWLADYLEDAHFYIDKNDREYFKEDITRPEQLYDILSVESVVWENQPVVSGITHATVTFDSTLGNPAVANFIMKDQLFRDIGSVIVESTDNYATDGTITITIAPALIGSGNVQINFVQSGLGINFAINVVEAANVIKEINLSSTSLSLTPGKTVMLEATYSPEEVYDPKLIWTSSNSQIADVDEQGNITAIGVGTATITCKALLGIASTKCTVIVEEPLHPGKALDDGTDIITVADVNAIASHIMGIEVENFNATNADANQDGSITISDVTTTVKMILNARYETEEYESVMAKIHAAMEDVPAVISFDDINSETAGTSNVFVRLKADDDYSAIQTDIICPQGLEISDITLASELTDHSLAWKKINDNRYRLIIYSVMNEILPSNEDEIAVIKLQAANSTFGALNTEFGWAATPSARKVSVTSSGGTVSGTTSISDILSEDEIVNVYNISGVLILKNIAISELNKHLAPGIFIIVNSKGSYKLHIN